MQCPGFLVESVVEFFALHEQLLTLPFPFVEGLIRKNERRRDADFIEGSNDIGHVYEI